MSIRIRKINGHLVALCAAKTKAKKGDIYLDDAIHEVLATKFAIDNERPEWVNPIKCRLMEKEENNRRRIK